MCGREATQQRRDWGYRGSVITLLTAGTVRPAGAQTNTSLGTGALGNSVAGRLLKKSGPCST
jgi:hypothetical protein